MYKVGALYYFLGLPSWSPFSLNSTFQEKNSFFNSSERKIASFKKWPNEPKF